MLQKLKRLPDRRATFLTLENVYKQDELIIYCSAPYQRDKIHLSE